MEAEQASCRPQVLWQVTWWMPPRHIGKVVTIFWNPEKLTLAPKEKMTHRFFVRMKSDAKDAKVFGDVEMIDAGIRREIGFLTPVMSEGEFEEKAKGLDIISMIRMEG